MIKVIFKDDFNFDILKDEIKVGSGNFIAEEDDTLGNNPYLEGIEIMGEYRNQGIGTKVLNTLVKEVGAYYLTPDNADATRLYERLGEKLEEDSKEYNDFGFAVDMGFGVYQIG